MIAQATLFTPALPPRAEMERAFLGRDASYDGLFFTGVRTTGIFCRPSCPARKPLAANVEFFGTPAEAMRAGYRACKRCQPLATGGMPGWVSPVLDALDAAPDRRLGSEQIRALGVEPARLRRYFQRQFGMTFQAYWRAQRMGRALERLQRGEQLDEVVFDTGYESHSGFREAFGRVAGRPPGEARHLTQVHFTRLETPIGPMVAAATGEAVCLLEFADRPMLPTQLESVRRRFQAVLTPGGTALLSQLDQELRAYFAGELREFSVPLLLPGTPFQERVWRALLEVPYGVTCSYEDLAQRIGAPGAQRAVGHANGMNRIAIVIPCHRVVGQSGQLTGYGGGLWRKRLLLHLEATGQPLLPGSVSPDASEGAAVNSSLTYPS
jgi:AraC family transcriptional regulator of adaptative response/methylated-DNA-[protein]-cysteine methyltransferase